MESRELNYHRTTKEYHLRVIQALITLPVSPAYGIGQQEVSDSVKKKTFSVTPKSSSEMKK